jgi:aminopeptidase-like protein
MQFKSKIVVQDKYKPLDFMPRGIDLRQYRAHQIAVSVVLALGFIVGIVILAGSVMLIAAALGA